MKFQSLQALKNLKFSWLVDEDLLITHYHRQGLEIDLVHNIIWHDFSPKKHP